MKISLIISTYNKPDYLAHVLQSIAGLNEFPEEVIIADDGSGQETAELIERFKVELSVPLIHVRQEDEGYRLARNRNNGILKSSGDYLIFIDDDIILHPKFISDHRKNAQKGSFSCGTRVRLGPGKTAEIFENHRNTISFWENNIQPRLNAIRIPFLHKVITGAGYTYKRLRGCHMAFWKEDLIRINGFDERYKSWGREDSDIAVRMMHAGFKRINLKWAALCYHLNHPVNEPISKNTNMLLDVMQKKKVRSEIGLDQHLQKNAKSQVDYS